MRLLDLAPALGLACLVTATLAVVELLPGGSGFALVRLGSRGIADVLAMPALADVAVVGLPAPGFAILRGDLGRIRAALGQAVPWPHGALCGFRP